MPSHFGRFRLLNDGIRFRNEGPEPVWVRPTETEPKIEVPPGAEVDLPYSDQGEVLFESDPG